MKRSRFLASTGALLSAALGVPAAAATPNAVRLQLSDAEIRHVADTLRHARFVRLWRAPSQFPAWHPLASFQGRQDDEGQPAIIWIDVDHLELMTPRVSHPADQDPLVAALVLAELDRHPRDMVWKHVSDELRPLSASEAHDAALGLAELIRERFPVQVVPPVSDAEFAAERFAFEVIRNMTPGIPGVEVDEIAPGAHMPKDAPLIAYIGRTDPRYPGAPVVLADSRSAPRNYTDTPEFWESYMRTYILATADMQPASSVEKRGYDAALAQDQRAGDGVYRARFAFAAAYLPRVRALASH